LVAGRGQDLGLQTGLDGLFDAGDSRDLIGFGRPDELGGAVELSLPGGDGGQTEQCLVDDVLAGGVAADRECVVERALGLLEVVEEQPREPLVVADRVDRARVCDVAGRLQTFVEPAAGRATSSVVKVTVSRGRR
jgi:hypothetical protein